jgi:NADH-quinone oxidoreductase subunit L
MIFSMKTLSLLVVLLPLLAGSLTGIINQKMSCKTAHRLTIFAVLLSFLASVWILYQLVAEGQEAFETTLYTWAHSGSIRFQVGFLIDKLSALMMVVVSFVSLMVHIYSIGYMEEDPGYRRFFCYISLFTFGMLMLVMSNNFLQLFFGWEAVGVMSYLLIGFWFDRESAIFASLKAFLVNRVGDLGFLLGIAAIFTYFNTLDYQPVFEGAKTLASNNTNIIFSANMEISAITVICLLLFVGAMGKSAQIPLHVWLPDSMEGPTPISALIHAATMVTAGVFMLARMSPLFEYSDTALNTVLLIGSLTCGLMALLGVVQNDIKRIIAYSTLSQLGYMMMAMGASNYAIGIFHLMTHAFFKALLFLAAGAVIIALHHEQNIWKMGNLRRYLPFTYICMWIGSLALIGFPFFSGFYSKDLIIEALANSHLPGASFAYWVSLGTVFVTAFYSFRLIFVVFHGKENIDSKLKSHLHEPSYVVWLPLLLLAIPSIMSGGLFIKPLLEGFFGHAIVVHGDHSAYAEIQNSFKGAISMGIHGFMGLPFYLGMAGLVFAWLCYVAYPKLPIRLSSMFKLPYRILQEKYGFDAFNQKILVPVVRKVGSVFWHLGDQGIIDGVAVNGSALAVKGLAGFVRHLQSGYLYHYVFTMITGFLFLLIFIYFSKSA